LDANAIFDAYQLIKESTMKIRLCLLIACLFSILVSSPVYAVHKAPLEAKSESITLKEGKKIKKIEKQLGKLESKIKKTMWTSGCGSGFLDGGLESFFLCLLLYLALV